MPRPSEIQKGIEAREAARRRDQDDAAKHAEQHELSEAYNRHYRAKAKIDAAALALKSVMDDADCRAEVGTRFLEAATITPRRLLEEASASIVRRWD